MYKLLHKIFGAYTLSVPVRDGIRLVNILNRKKILFWGVRNTGDSICFKASLFSCEACIRTAAENEISATIVETIGIPFVFSKYKGRYGLILGSFVGLFLISCAQLFIWEISITGNDNIPDAAIINTLSKFGVTRGAYIPDLEINIIEELVLMDNTNISSISINIKGSYAEINLLERAYPPEMNKPGQYCNLIASDDGIVMKVEAIDGTPEVKTGEVVYKGQILVNSFMLGKFGQYRPTHARGEVLARVREKFTVTISLEQEEKIYTGRTETIKSIDILGYSFNFLAKDTSSFELYDTEVSLQEKKLLGVLKTPVTVTTTLFKEYRINRYSISEEEAKSRAANAFSGYLDRIEHEIVTYDCDGRYYKKKNAYVLTASVVVLKNIAVEKEIKIID